MSSQFYPLPITFSALLMCILILNNTEMTHSRITKHGKGNFLDLKRSNSSSLSMLLQMKSKTDKVREISHNPLTILENTVSMVSNVITIWAFLETRETAEEQSITSEMLDEWTEHLEDLSSQIDDVNDSLKKIACKIDSLHTLKNNNISESCLELTNSTTEVTNSTVLNITNFPQTNTTQPRKKANFSTPVWFLGFN